MMAKMLGHYGTEMILHRGDEAIVVRGFLQDTKSLSQSNLHRSYSALGEELRGMYRYIGPAEPMAQEGDTLQWAGRTFEIRRIEPVMQEDHILYCWGLCIERGGEL